MVTLGFLSGVVTVSSKFNTLGMADIPPLSPEMLYFTFMYVEVHVFAYSLDFMRFF